MWEERAIKQDDNPSTFMDGTPGSASIGIEGVQYPSIRIIVDVGWQGL
jgi:hypothetical protein